MANSNAIRAGRAFVELFTDERPLVRGLNAIKGHLNSFGATVAKMGAGLTAIGGAIGGPLLVAAKTFADVGSSLADMSQRTGVGVEQLSALKFAADQTGTSMEGLEKGLRKQQRTISEAAAGNEAAAAAIVTMGLSVEELQGLSADEAFLKIADQISRIPDAADRAAVSMGIFGKSGADLLPLMINGEQGIRALMEEARELGLVMSTEDAFAAEAFGDMLGKVQAVIARLVVSIGGALAPALSNVAALFTEGNVSINEWIQKNGDMVRLVALLATGLVAAGAAMTAIGVAIKIVAAGFGLAATAITATAAVLGALASPVGVLTAAVVAGVGAWLVYSESGQAALVALANVFGQLQADAMTAITGIVDALAAGDIALAGEVAMAGLNVAWQTGLAGLTELWINLKDGVHAAFIELSTAIRAIWVELFAELSRAFPGLVKIAAQAGSSIQGFFENAAGHILEGVGVITEAERIQAEQTRADARARELQATFDDVDRANANPDQFVNEELAKLEAARQAAQAARAAGTAEEIRTAEASLEAARKKLTEASERASAARAAVEGGTAAATQIKVLPPDMDEIEDKLGKAAESMADAQEQMPQAMALGSREAAEHILKSLAPGSVQQSLEQQQLARIAEGNRYLQDLIRVSEGTIRMKPSTI